MIQAKHKFFLTPPIDRELRRFDSIEDGAPEATIDDDLVNYIHDTLYWIPSVNPTFGMKAQSGLNLCGVTLINAEGALVMKRVFEAWLGLFQLAPEELHITGQFVLEPGKEGSYEQIQFHRPRLLGDLSRVIELCDKAISSNGDRVILHFGI